jgi:hypothetical protein
VKVVGWDLRQEAFSFWKMAKLFLLSALLAAFFISGKTPFSRIYIFARKY